MIEISTEHAFISGYHPGIRWICARCNRGIPDEIEYVDADGVRDVLRSSNLVYNAEIIERVSSYRLCIIVAAAALAGGMVVFTFDRAPLFLTFCFSFVVSMLSACLSLSLCTDLARSSFI
jgi:hypothetical protein